MTLNSFEFFIFLLIASVIYFIIPKKAKRLFLLAVSLAFYTFWNIPNTVILLSTAIGTYFIGILCERNRKTGYDGRMSRTRSVRKRYLTIGIIALIGELFVYKYWNFAFQQVNKLLSVMEIRLQFPTLANVIVPLGISFYIFQSIGYIVDVYQGKIEAERNVINFLLYITFFPKIIQGPIERSDGLLNQIRRLNTGGGIFNFQRVSNGLITFIWGLFMKMVIADRIAIIVDNVFSTYYIYGTVELVFAAVCYAIQIYCDFAGYSSMAVGAARIFGLELINNFDVPYFSVSTREFWRRWHISLSAWFRDYVYIPLGGSRCAKWRKSLNILIVMLVSGIWHGAGWNFVIWGLIHGIYQIVGDVSSPWRDKLKKRLNVPVGSASYKLGGMIITFMLIDFAWIFFRAPDIGSAMDYIRCIFTRFNPWVLFDGSLLKLGLDQIEMNILGMVLLILVIVDYIQYKRKIRLYEMLENQCLWFRWGVIILLFTMIWVCGEYGPYFSSSSFIYQSF